MMGKTNLIRSVLNSMPIDFLANTVVSSSCLRMLEQLFQNFLWASVHNSRGLHLISWKIVCQPLRDGGLGIHFLLARREILIARHAARYILQPNCLWSKVMRADMGLGARDLRFNLLGDVSSYGRRSVPAA